MGLTRRTASITAISLWILSCGADKDEPFGTWDTGSGDTAVVDTTWDPAADLPPADSTSPDGGPDVPADLWDDEVCGTEDLPLEYEVNSDVLIIMDRSGSMMLTLGSVKTAINTIVGSSDDKIWFGLMPFPSTVAPNVCALINPFTECAAPATAHVTLGPNRAADVAGVLASTSFCGSTPTSETLRNAHSYLSSTATGHNQYVLLATDGVPNCNDTLDPDTCVCGDTTDGCVDRPTACIDDQAAYDALDAMAADGIPTYVLGVGAWAGADETIMDNMAIHGGTGSFYPAADPASILAAFETIMGTVVVSCRFDLHPGDDVDPTKVNLYIDGIIVPNDPSHANGWDWVDADTVEFYGAWCTAILEGDTGGVSASYGCPTYII